MILRTGGTEKSCGQWEEILVGQKTWQSFKNHFAQAYKCYNIRKTETSVDHGYGDAANHAQETDSQMMTANALQALTNVEIADKESIANLISIKLELSQILTQ